MAISPKDFPSISRSKEGESLTMVATFETTDIDPKRPLDIDARNRVVIALLRKTSAGTSRVIANIPIKDMGEIKDNNEVVSSIRAQFWMKGASKTGDAKDDSEGFQNSPAFTVPLILTAFKNRTAGEVLATDPSQKKELLKGKEFLAANLAKYPNNQKQIDAINDAVQLLEIGELEGRNVSSSKACAPFVIYETEYKYMSTKDSDGRNLCYQIGIYYDYTRNNPFEMKIVNYYAPTVKQPSGMVFIDAGKAVNRVVQSFHFTQSEWSNFHKQLQDEAIAFKLYRAPVEFKLLKEASYSYNSANRA